MGLFADMRWSEGLWSEPSEVPVGPWLRITIHDSDIGVIGFAPAADAEGLFFLGFEPATYFEDPAANGPVDHDAEAKAFSVWTRDALGRAVDPVAVRAVMARPGRDPEDVFVEETVGKLLAMIGLELPDID